MKILGIDEQPLTHGILWHPYGHGFADRETHWSSSAGKSEFP